MISILFVDEKAELVERLRDAFYRRKSEWNVEHAKSQPQAIELLRASKFDIIITDSQVSGFDGVDLLNHVHAKYPGMTRILLTKPSEIDSIARMSEAAHQFAFKPCVPTDLVALIGRAGALNSRIQSEIVRRLVGGTKHVPSAPRTALKIASLIAKGEATVQEVGELIERDPGLSVRVLQVANSALFRRSRELTNVSDAVSFIGFETAKALAIANEAFRITPENKFLMRLIDDTCEKAFWGAAMTSKFLSGHPLRETAMTAALVRDIGILITANANPQIYKVAMDRHLGANSIADVERTCLGVTHAEIGGHLLALWGIPVPIVEAVTYHHAIQESSMEAKVMTAIHVADIVAEHQLSSLQEVRDAINWLFIDVNDLRDEVEEWLELDLKSYKIAA